MIGLNFVQVMYDLALVNIRIDSNQQNQTVQSARSINNKPIRKSTSLYGANQKQREAILFDYVLDERNPTINRTCFNESSMIPVLAKFKTNEQTKN